MNSDTIPAGVLNDKRIEESLNWNPPLITNEDKARIQPCSYDLRIGTVFHNGRILTKENSAEQVVIKPGDLISVFTEEEVHLPPNIMATVFPINKMSSQGILVLNPGHIDPGFNGPLTVKLINLRLTDKVISFGERIFTIIFEKLPEKAVKPYPAVPMRQDRERDFNELDVEYNPRSLGKMMARGDNPPFVSIEEVRTAILHHWTTWVVGVLTLVAAIFSVLAVIRGGEKSNGQEKNASATQGPSPEGAAAKKP
jgi:deoxycytidine triphosphate deaminase